MIQETGQQHVVGTDTYQRSTLQQYRHEIGQFPLLTGEEEVRLRREMREGEEWLEASIVTNGLMALFNGDYTAMVTHEVAQAAQERAELARKTFITSNLRLVVSIAQRYRDKTDVDVMDLIQEGNLGMAHAVDMFDEEKGFKFSTYATNWIRQAITRAIDNQTSTVRVSVQTREFIRQIKRTEKWLRETGKEVTDEAVARQLGVTVTYMDAKRKTFYQASQPLELNRKVSDTETSTEYGDMIPDAQALEAYDAVEVPRKAELMKVLEKCLNPKQYAVLVACFGLDDGQPKSAQAVGDMFGFSRQNIQQIKNSALRKLRANPNAQHQFANLYGEEEAAIGA